MTTAAAGTFMPQRTVQRERISPAARATRIIAAIVLVAASVALGIFNETFRSFEATLATLTLSPIADNQLPASGIRYFIWAAPDYLVALRVTIECTALIFGVPLTIAAALMLAFTRIPAARVLTAIALMWIIVLLVNTVRLWVIGWATQTWGMDPGYQISHTFVGSIIGILGFVAGVATLLIVMGFTPSHRKRVN